jgi:hypothetical protein
VGKSEEKRPLEYEEVGGNIKMDHGERMEWIDVAQDSDSYEHSNGALGSIICWEVLELLHNWQPIKKGSATWS